MSHQVYGAHLRTVRSCIRRVHHLIIIPKVVPKIIQKAVQVVHRMLVQTILLLVARGKFFSKFEIFSSVVRAIFSIASLVKNP